MNDGGRIAPHPVERRSVLSEIQDLLADRLDLVEDELERHLRSEVGIIDELGAYLADGGGKRIRPLLLLLTSGLTGYQGPWDVKFAAVLEFIHTATLVHDDIIDEAATRRGKKTVNRIYGNDLTVLLGDHLYIKAMNMAVEANRIDILKVLASVTLKMIEGELIAHHHRGSLDLTAEHHLDIVRRKTAYLFSGCCQVAALLGEVSPEMEASLARYGMELGIAFQLVDDILDLTADETILGKPVASDLREGRLTLPLIYLLEEGDPEHRRLVGTVIREGEFRSVSLACILDLIRECGTLERTRDLARKHAQEAVGQMDRYGDGPYAAALKTLPLLLLKREH